MQQATYYLARDVAVVVEGPVKCILSFSTGKCVKLTHPCNVVVNAPSTANDRYEVSMEGEFILVKSPTVDSTRCWTFYTDCLTVVETFQVGVKDSIDIWDNGTLFNFVFVQGTTVTVYDKHLQVMFKCTFPEYATIEQHNLKLYLSNAERCTCVYVYDLVEFVTSKGGKKSDTLKLRDRQLEGPAVRSGPDSYITVIVISTK